MKKIVLGMMAMFLAPGVAWSMSSVESLSCEPEKIKIKVIAFAPGNGDASAARSAVINALKDSGYQIVTSGSNDYAIEGTVEYSYDAATRENKISGLTVLALTENATLNATTSGGLSPTSDPSTLGNTAGEIAASKICKHYRYLGSE